MIMRLLCYLGRERDLIAVDGMGSAGEVASSELYRIKHLRLACEHL